MKKLVDWTNCTFVFLYYVNYIFVYIILLYRVDFYESCVDQLKKEIPRYVGKLSGMSSGFWFTLLTIKFNVFSYFSLP